ncbi:hypothetical protein [Buttiauxella massiliensis]|uniref:hypothetical protein n=1 Tax=Buttiauxella massiliensis TaxID=2831590 RepID=UPI001D002D80|nr:hypothetical protein [Buttiauxella massiliensis]
MNKIRIALSTVLLISASVSAAVTEQEWGNWYGNTGGMEFALNTQNRAGQALTVSCSNKQMLVTLSSQKENWSARSDEALDDLYLRINNKTYELSNDTMFPNEPVPAQLVFEALAHAKASDTIVFTSRQTGDSKPFSARGLNEALKGITWQDCMNQS